MPSVIQIKAKVDPKQEDSSHLKTKYWEVSHRNQVAWMTATPQEIGRLSTWIIVEEKLHSEETWYSNSKTHTRTQTSKPQSRSQHRDSPNSTLLRTSSRIIQRRNPKNAPYPRKWQMPSTIITFWKVVLLPHWIIRWRRCFSRGITPPRTSLTAEVRGLHLTRTGRYQT